MGSVEIPKWLKDLPLAPEFRPTDTEFADPIAYISKIEKEASVFGICKIVPPLPKPSKRYVFSNLNRSLAKSPELGEDVDLSNVCSSSKVGSGDGGNSGEGRAVFTTRHQELGQSVKRPKGVVKENSHLGVHKQVWQSGEIYTLEQFESKSKAFAKSFLGMIKEVNPLVIEALFWKATSEKPIYVEYANDVPGSAFGEPEGQFRYFNRRRRKRASYQSYRRNRENSNWMKNTIDSVRSCSNDNAKSSCVNNDPSTSPEVTPSSSTTVSTLSSEEILRSSKRKTVNGSSDMEGTAGWKLSNSPWNLQVIARSSGSLTRYMPDDIPGVTSPMVYIGMLFSWFAWHVEDHELHSLNFLHTGSPKTWYAVPGDYAFPFEEVIRTQAYCGNIDRLAALTLLGEKTTLLSPEIVISSGIPCCRLVQNPGEFVVTFPRAYHVGFSHGFNCGEAANFGTPQWLQVAKEAAVRRAAMNYLPMLSHQQLLYLLTMSFVSRVPRSMLPGARSSRLRDRQKEERELSVKKAFIEDMLKENNTLSLLLGKDSSYQVVIWNPDLLPCASKESQLPMETTPDVITTRENVCDTHSESNVNSTESDLFKEMSLYMEALNDLYVDDDDLSCDFQVDSGTLACVACGILGFPFMSVVQPSERAAAELVPKNNLFVQEGPAVTTCDNGQSSAQPCSSAEVPISDGLPDVSNQFLPLKDLSLPKGWNTSSKSLRPRIFCLEHGLQIEELLESKGGANLLIICHSDYQKIKAHATVIAEEINTPFNCSEVSLESATQEDLNLIYLAIDDEDYDEGGKDWTSELGINLRYCVKVRKNSPWKQVHHALALGGLFSDNSSSSDFITIKWQSRRSRSRIKINQPAHFKPGDNVETNKDEVLGKKSDVAIVKKEEKLIHYTRRKYKLRVGCPSNEEQGCLKKNLLDASVSSCEDIDKHEAGVHEPTVKVLLKHAPSQIAGSLLTTTIGVETVLEQTKGKTLEESNREQNVHNEAARSCLEVQYEMKATERFDETEDSFAMKCSEPCVTAGDEKFGTPTDRNKDSINNMDETCDKFSEGQLNRDFSVNKVSDLAKSPSSPCLDASPPATVHMENVVVDKPCNACISGTLDDKVHLELQTSKSSAGKFVSCSNALNQPTSEDMCKCPLATPEAETVVQENKFTSENNQEEHILEDAELISQPALADLDGSSGIDVEPCPALSDFQPVVHSTNADENELVTPMKLDQTTSVSVDKPSEVCATACAEDLCTSSTLDNEVLPEIPTARQANIDITVSDSAKITQDYPTHPPSASEEECLSEGTCAAEDTRVDVKSDINLRQGRDDKDHDVQQNASSRGEEPVCCHVTPTSVQECSGVEEGFHARENIAKGIEVCSQSELQSPELRGIDPKSNPGKSRKRKNELDQIMEHNYDFSGFIRSPCEGLRPRSGKNAASRSMVDKKLENRVSTKANPVTKRARKPSDCSGPRQRKKEITRTPHKCDLEGCTMSFETKAELRLHKRNRCPYDGCRKRFSSHKYAIIHQRVHEDDRPLKCPWKGCSMSFKWAWARTEHIRVHTGERPYKCKVEGCGLSFRFVSDFSRHRRKTGHHVDSPA